MRKTGIKLAGLAVVLAGVAGAEPAEANDVTISTATTTPVTTSSPDGVSPGNVTVAAAGSIAVTAGQSAITLNSNNTVTNSGTTGLTSSNADNTTGIRITGGFTGAVTNSGAITLSETYTPTDTDNDGDLDGVWAQGTGRNGILLQAGAAHTGNITSNGAITIRGVNSAGVRLDALLNGNLNLTTNVTITGDNSYAYRIAGGSGAGVNGDVIVNGGAITVRGAGSGGLLVDAPITGALRIAGTWSVSGFHSTTPPTTTAATTALDADDLLLSNSAVEVHFSVGQGVTITGIGVEDDTDDDGDGVTEAAGDLDDDLTAAITTFSSAPAILISADPSANLALGATASGYGLNIRGPVTAAGVYDHISSTAVRVQGSGATTTTTAGGVLNDAVLNATASEANATGIVVGQNATVPTVLNRGSISAATAAQGVSNAYGILVETGANVSAITNSGTISAQAFGELNHAHAIVDRSGTLTSITNSGTIRAQTIATDDDLSDGVTPVATGDAVAIDLSLSSAGATLNQIADTPFNDQDTVDDDAGRRPAVRIEGDVLFGSGADTFNLLAGSMVGDLSFGAGADNFTINNGASFTGRLTDTGALALNVVNGSLNLTGGTTNLTTAQFGANSTLSVVLSTNLADTTHMIASGAVSFAPGAVVTPIIPVGLPASGASIFLTANGGLTGAANVVRTITGSGTPWIYDLSVAVALADPNSLEARYTLKSAAQLGLGANEAAAFDPILAALRNDAAASGAFALLNSQETFAAAYDDLLPSFSSGSTELATTAIQQSQSAATNRLAATRMHDVDDVTVWAQEIGYGLTRTPQTTGIEFRGFGFGLAMGIDGPLDNGGLFGLSASFVTSQVEEPGRPDGEIAASFGQANAYLGSALGPIDLDLVGGLGAGKMSSRRVIQIGPSFDATTEADWWAYEGHAAARASLPLRMGDTFVITPQVAVTYMALNEEGYAETGGGAGLDVTADSAMTQRLWADAGVEFAARFRTSGEGVIAPRVMLGYRANALSEDAERTFHFGSGADFTLVDGAAGDGAPLVGVGIDATNGYSTFSLSYEGEFGDEIDRHSLNLAARFKF